MARWRRPTPSVVDVLNLIPRNRITSPDDAVRCRYEGAKKRREKRKYAATFRPHVRRRRAYGCGNFEIEMKTRVQSGLAKGRIAAAAHPPLCIYFTRLVTARGGECSRPPRVLDRQTMHSAVV